MDFSMNLLKPKSYYSPYNSGYEENVWRCAWCMKTFNIELSSEGYCIYKNETDEIDLEMAEWDKIIEEFTVYEDTEKYGKRSTLNVGKVLKYTNWCSGCKQLTRQCCTAAENGCAFDDYYARFISSFNQIPGSPIVPISKARQFIKMLIDGITIESWCACPGFCPQYSVCEHRTGIPWRDNHCCKYDKIESDKYPGWKRVHTKYHAEIAKGKTRRELADWAKANLIKWPYSNKGEFS